MSEASNPGACRLELKAPLQRDLLEETKFDLISIHRMKNHSVLGSEDGNNQLLLALGPQGVVKGVGRFY